MSGWGIVYGTTSFECLYASKDKRSYGVLTFQDCDVAGNEVCCNARSGSWLTDVVSRVASSTVLAGAGNEQVQVLEDHLR